MFLKRSQNHGDFPRLPMSFPRVHSLVVNSELSRARVKRAFLSSILNTRGGFLSGQFRLCWTLGLDQGEMACEISHMPELVKHSG